VPIKTFSSQKRNTFRAQKKNKINAGGVKNRKFVTLTPYQKNRPKSMKPPRPMQRKFAFKLSYRTTTTKNKETLHSFDRIIY
jgi:hypothetical protein